MTYKQILDILNAEFSRGRFIVGNAGGTQIIVDKFMEDDNPCHLTMWSRFFKNKDGQLHGTLCENEKCVAFQHKIEQLIFPEYAALKIR